MKIYSRWAKPYLRAAQELEMNATGKNPERNPSLVKTFNTIFLELTILGKSKLDIKSSVLERALPLELENVKKWNFKRDYFSCILVDFKFRGIPQRIDARTPQYVFGGRTEIIFTSYALNSDEIKALDSELEKSDISDVLKLVEGMTTESLEKFQQDINYFLEEKDFTKTEMPGEKESPKKNDESNPFLALIGAYNKSPKEPEKIFSGTVKSEILAPDNWIEKTQLRRVAGEKAKATTFNAFDIYKQAHGMMSYT